MQESNYNYVVMCVTQTLRAGVCPLAELATCLAVML